MKTKKTYINLPIALATKLQAIAKREKRSLTKTIEKIVEEHLNNRSVADTGKREISG